MNGLLHFLNRIMDIFSKSLNIHLKTTIFKINKCDYINVINYKIQEHHTLKDIFK